MLHNPQNRTSRSVRPLPFSSRPTRGRYVATTDAHRARTPVSYRVQCFGRAVTDDALVIGPTAFANHTLGTSIRLIELAPVLFDSEAEIRAL